MIHLPDLRKVRRVLCLGAHSDDIEIGCGGTLLRLAAEAPGLHVRWVVLGASDERRAREARDSAARFLAGAAHADVRVEGFRDAYLPFHGAEVKDRFEALKADFLPDLIFTHFRDDRHQDHRLLSDLTWNTWRDHLILEYEIFKYDGDLGHPNLFAPLPEDVCQRKVELILAGFPSQAGRQWFTEDVLWSMLRLRGAECNSPTRYAEAFYCRKIVM